MKTLDLLGTKIHAISFKEALEKAEELLRDGKQHYIVTPNPEIVLKAMKDRKYRAILNKADLRLPDGVGLVLASRVLYGRTYALQERITGVDFVMRFLSHMSYKTHRSYRTYRILLLGGNTGVARKAAAILGKKFPGFEFYAIGNTRYKHLSFLINHLIQPDCVFVALGAPAQERWIARNMPKFQGVKLAMGVGGAFDMISRDTPRAPSCMRYAGLEWLWRFTIEPWRAGRIFQAAVIFPLFVLAKKFRP